MPSVASDLITLGIGGAVAIGASAILTWRVEHVGARLRISEALLGLVAALGADSPEITSSATALHSGQHVVGIGVVLGSNVFNLAALLGLGAIAAGRIALHRNVILLEGSVSLWLVALVLLLAGGVLSTAEALALALVAMVPYCALAGMRARSIARLPIGRRRAAWLAGTLRAEDVELGPMPKSSGGTIATDVVTIAGTLGIVLVASIEMEHAGVAVGAHFAIPPVIVGGILLAAITSLPNVVAAVYLALHGRGAAVLSEAMNSNALNVVVGLLIPGVAVGLGAHTASLRIAWWYGGLTLAAVAIAYLTEGISRRVGLLVLAAYAAFVLSTVLT